MAVVIDQPVADFEAPATSGQTVSLSALKGKQVVIYFYPKDSTPGCTTEGQGFRDQYAAFKAANELYTELSDTNANWKKIYPDYSRFLADAVQWESVAEGNYAQYLAAQKL